MQPGGGSSQLEIQIDDKTYAGANGKPVTAVSGFALAVEQNSFVALLGPSGCGKTTILQIVAGLDHDFRGSINWNMAPHIGFVFQEPRLLPWRTVRQNIELALDHDAPGEEVPALAAAAGISKVLDRFPGELSLGLARRVAIARAFACKPNVLLLDEPFVSLDEPNARKLRALLMKVWSERPVTAFLVTHSLHDALELADRLILLAPRPTKIITEIELNIPRKVRSERQINQLRTQIKAGYPAFFESDEDCTPAATTADTPASTAD